MDLFPIIMLLPVMRMMLVRMMVMMMVRMMMMTTKVVWSAKCGPRFPW